jgi:hypothetical protein
LVPDDEYTPEMLAMLERQIAYFSSDELLLERAAPWRDASPEECLLATKESCEEVEWCFERMEPEVRERARQPEPIPDEILRILEAMQQ